MESVKDQLEHHIQKSSFQQKYHELKQQILLDADIQQFIQINQLTQSVVEKSYPKFFEYLTEKKRIAETGFSSNTGFSPQLQFVNNYVDVTYVPTEAYKEWQHQLALENRIRTLQMPKNIKSLTLSDVDFTDDRFDILSYLSDFSNQYRTKQFVKGAYIYGTFGIGKTFLLGALAGTLAQKGVHSYLVHVPSLIFDLKNAIGDNTLHEKLAELKTAQILMLDDIGGENLTQWVRDDIFMTLLDYRMREQLPTFFTSNLSFDQLEEHFKGTTIEDERKAKRIMERIKFLSQPFLINGANRRN